MYGGLKLLSSLITKSDKMSGLLSTLLTHSTCAAVSACLPHLKWKHSGKTVIYVGFHWFVVATLVLIRLRLLPWFDHRPTSGPDCALVCRVTAWKGLTGGLLQYS